MNHIKVLEEPTAGGKQASITYVPVAQGAAGTTQLIAASPGRRHKILGAVIVLDAAGSVKFSDGSDITGPMSMDANGGFVWPAGNFPYTQTAVGSALSIVSVTGKANGVVTVLTEID
mgnify:CR=1 FL=1